MTAELDSYKRQVKNTLHRVAREFGFSGTADVERELGLDAIQDLSTVTVTFEVPAEADTAKAAVEAQVNAYRGYIPAGWNVTVS